MKKNLLSLVAFAFSLNVYASDIKIPVQTTDAPAPIGTYSQSIQYGNMLFISGQIPIDPKTGELVNGDFKTQVRQVFANLAAIAKAAQGDVNDFLKLTIYLDDLSHFNEVNDVMQELFHEPYPARAVIGISHLPKNAPIEIEAIMGLFQKK